MRVGEPQHFAAVLARLIDMSGQLDLRLGERAGLVGAQDVHGAKVVDRGQALHDHAARCQPPRPMGQRHRDDHRQQLGRETDGKGQREQSDSSNGPMERELATGRTAPGTRSAA